MAYISFQPKDHFNTKLYTGTGSSLAITGMGFQPDWTWIYNYGGTYSSAMYDAVRGVTKHIESTGNGGEQTVANTLTSFDSNGFTVGADGNSYVNRSSAPNTYVAWNWKMGGTGSANTAGTINSTVSANTTAGFSIVSYTGTGANATVGHGLGAAPAFYMVKSRNNAYDWRCYHQSLGNGKYIDLNGTGGAATNSNAWNNTSPTSTVFSLSTGSTPNANGGTFVAYCFAEKPGFSKFGKYTGNGNGNGSFVYTGFRPAMLIIKNYTNGTGDPSIMYDDKRIGYNPNNNVLEGANNNAEASSDRIDILSNGFKLRYNWTPINKSGDTYIYMAFGQSLVGSNNIPCTAR